MEFFTLTLPDVGQVVFAKGPIISGDAERLLIALQTASRDRFGNKTLGLHSDGGLVGEAMRMVSLMDQEKVTTIVPPGATCASACAQIVFLAGVYRAVLDGGRLGIHSCSIHGAKSELCNQMIAKNALDHGTEYGSVMAFMKADPSDMVWFGSKDVDCYGISRWPPEFDRGTKPGEIAPCVKRHYDKLTSSERMQRGY
jgi:hypothetical protein